MQSIARDHSRRVYKAGTETPLNNALQKAAFFSLQRLNFEPWEGEPITHVSFAFTAPGALDALPQYHGKLRYRVGFGPGDGHRIKRIALVPRHDSRTCQVHPC